MSLHGKPITLAHANRQVREYLTLKLSGSMPELLSGITDLKLLEYYKGEELSFVFEKEMLDELFKTPFSNGIRIYYGCLDALETREGKEGGPAVELQPGTPTLILVPCNIQPDGAVKNLVHQGEDDLVACEHPGLQPFQKMPAEFDLRSD